MWPAFAFNLVAALLIAGWFLRSVRRLERRMDARLAHFEHWADAEDAKFDAARNEMQTSLRARVDRMIAEMQAMSINYDSFPGLNGDVHIAEFPASITNAPSQVLTAPADES